MECRWWPRRHPRRRWKIGLRGIIIVIIAYVCQIISNVTSSNLNKCCSSSLFLWSDGIKQLITIKYRWNVLYNIGICVIWALMVIDRCSLYLFAFSVLIFSFLNELLMLWTGKEGWVMENVQVTLCNIIFTEGNWLLWAIIASVINKYDFCFFYLKCYLIASNLAFWAVYQLHLLCFCSLWTIVSYCILAAWFSNFKNNNHLL